MSDREALIRAIRELVPAYVDEATSIVAALLDSEGRVVVANRAWKALFRSPEGHEGRPASEYVRGIPWNELESVGDIVRHQLEALVPDDRSRHLASWIQPRADGYLLVGEIRGQEADDVIAQMSEIHQEMADITRELSKKNAALERAKARIEELARTDDLTGLLNRRHFGEEVERMISFARRHDQPLALVLGDVDHFKRVNDEHGHGTGDEVLAAVAELLEDSCRKEDLAGRYGGEEFVLALPNTDHEAALQFADRARRQVAERSGERAPVGVTISMGVAVLRDDDDLGDLAHRADQAMYRAKERGRNRVEAAD